MPCLAALLALISPRLALFFLLVFSHRISDAFDDTWLVPILGFLLLPWTTLAYVLMWAAGPSGVTGFEWFIVALAFLGDVGVYSGGNRTRRSRPRRH